MTGVQTCALPIWSHCPLISSLSFFPCCSPSPRLPGGRVGRAWVQRSREGERPSQEPGPMARGPAARALSCGQLVSVGTTRGCPSNAGPRPLCGLGTCWPVSSLCGRLAGAGRGAGSGQTAVFGIRGACLCEPACSRRPACPTVVNARGAFEAVRRWTCTEQRRRALPSCFCSPVSEPSSCPFGAAFPLLCFRW